MKHLTKPFAASAAKAETPLLPLQASSVVILNTADLSTEHSFSPRIGLAKLHVHDLARALRNGGKLAPIKVWAEPETGRLIVLDGLHRIAAYHYCDKDRIPARIFNVDRKAARLEAAKDNSKASFPWSTSECTQYAWGLVIEGEGSKAEISDAASVSIGTITNMRKRLAAMLAAGVTPTGNWLGDRNETKPEGKPEDDSDAAKQARIRKLQKWLSGAEAEFKCEFGRRPTTEELGMANRWNLGMPRFKAMVSGGCLVDEDEFSRNPEEIPVDQLLYRKVSTCGLLGDDLDSNLADLGQLLSSHSSPTSPFSF